MFISRRALLTALIVLGLSAPAAAAAPPAPCGGTPQITDPTGDGHHSTTDVTAAWLADAGSGVQAVIQMRSGGWAPSHDEPDAVAGFALLFVQGGVTRYVRVEAPRDQPLRYDHGTWTRAGGFAAAGAATGSVTEGVGGAATIDVPGVPAGTVLGRPFVLTYDGPPSGEPHWVDRAPGGTSPDATDVGADFVAGACGAGVGADPVLPGGPAAPAATTAVRLTAPARITGGGTARIRGSVVPARGGVQVTVRASSRRPATRTVTTAADGSFALNLPVSERTRLRASVGPIGSQTLTVRMLSRVRIAVRRVKGGGYRVTGTVAPLLPGRVLLLRTTSATPSARATVRQGRFAIRLRRPRPGRYQAVFIPSGERAERSISNTKALS